MKLEGKAKMLRIHFGEDDKWHGKPLYQAIVESSTLPERRFIGASKAMAPVR